MTFKLSILFQRNYLAKNGQFVTHIPRLINKSPRNMTSKPLVAESGKQAARVRALRFFRLPHRATAQRTPHRAEVHSVLRLFQVAAVTAIEQVVFTHGSVLLHCRHESPFTQKRPYLVRALHPRPLISDTHPSDATGYSTM